MWGGGESRGSIPCCWGRSPEGSVLISQRQCSLVLPEQGGGCRDPGREHCPLTLPAGSQDPAREGHWVVTCSFSLSLHNGCIIHGYSRDTVKYFFKLVFRVF